MTAFHPVNPHYAARTRAAFPAPPQKVRLPRAPMTASPVPRLTSLYAVDDPGPWGDRSDPGNCSGHLLRDLLLFFRPARVFDPFAGSGTAAAVCRDLGVPCQTIDVRHGQDPTSPAYYPRTPVPFVWAHPPYWRQKRYTDDPRDLSRAATLAEFLAGYGRFVRAAAGALAPGGTLAVLIGDYADREAGFVPLTFHTQRLAFAAGLEQRHTAVVRFGHGASSGRRAYRSSFIPGLQRPSTQPHSGGMLGGSDRSAGRCGHRLVGLGRLVPATPSVPSRRRPMRPHPDRPVPPRAG